MKGKLLSLLATLLVAPALATTPAPVCDIEMQSNQMERGMCAARLYKQADDYLNRLYKQQVKYEVDAKDLRDAQKAWLEYRDKSCAYEAPQSPPDVQGGSGEAEDKYRCLASYTLERARRLEDYIECQSWNGPCISGRASK